MTGAAAALAASPAADSGSEFPGVLDGVLLAGPAARLAAMLDQGFLAGAGWDPGSRMLSLPAGHPLQAVVHTAAVLDADGDGFLDLYLVNCETLPGAPQPRHAASRFYHNRGPSGAPVGEIWG